MNHDERIDNNNLEQPVITNSVPVMEPVMTSSTSVNSVPTISPVEENQGSIPSFQSLPTMENVSSKESYTPPVVEMPSSVDSSVTPSVVEMPSSVDSSLAPSVVEMSPIGENPSVGSDVQPRVIDSTDALPPTPKDDGVIITDKMEKVEIQYKPPGKGKIIALVLLFVLLIAFIVFLPEVTEFARKVMGGGNTDIPERITTGKLNCSYETSTENLEKNYDVTFTYTDSRLEKMTYVIVTRGDISLDEKELDSLAADCKQLAQNVDSLEGVSVRCDYMSGKLTETESFDLENLDQEKLTAAFYEAGGHSPGFEYHEKIELVERNMNASGYTCTRSK